MSLWWWWRREEIQFSNFFQQIGLVLANAIGALLEPAADLLFQVGVSVLPEPAVIVVRMRRRNPIGNASAHVRPALPAYHFILLRLVNGAPDQQVHSTRTQIASLSTDVSGSVSFALEATLSFLSLDGLLVLLPAGLLVGDRRILILVDVAVAVVITVACIVLFGQKLGDRTRRSEKQ